LDSGQQVARLDQDHLAGAFEVAEQALAIDHRQVLDFVEHGLGLLDGLLVAVLLEAGAFFVEAGLLAAQLLDSFARLVLETRLAAVHVVEAAGQFAGELDVRNLVLAHRHLVGAVDQDIGAHQQRIAEEAVGGQILVGQLFLLVLVGRHALQPAERRHHRHQQVQLGVLGHLGLDEQRRLVGIDTGRQPVDHVHRRFSMPCGLSYCVVRACQSATKNRQGYSCWSLTQFLRTPW
jgi:hypothetical protein